jgi:hypothetical protein
MAAASGSTEDLKAKAQQLHQTVFADTASDAESVKQKEEAIGQLSDTYVKLQDAKALTELLSQLRPFFGVIPKAKTAKIVRNIVDQIAKIPNSTDIQVGLQHRSMSHVQQEHAAVGSSTAGSDAAVCRLHCALAGQHRVPHTPNVTAASARDIHSNLGSELSFGSMCILPY